MMGKVWGKIKRRKKGKIGRKLKTVWIGETYLTKRKDCKELILKNWCVEETFREKNDQFFEISHTRNAEKLGKIVKKYISKKTTIITEFWKGYNGLANLVYIYKIINHKKRVY